MERYACSKIMEKLEKFYPKHQIFSDVYEQRDEKRILKLKQVIAIADLFGLNEFYDAFNMYVEECIEEPIFNLVEAVIFELQFKNTYKEFEPVFQLFELMQKDGISEFPISCDYSLESWIVKWIDYNSYNYIPELLEWFFIDFDELDRLKNRY